MPSQPHPPRRAHERAKSRPTPGADADGVRVSDAPGVRKSVWLLVAAMALVAATLLAVGRLVLHTVSGATAPVVAAAEPEPPAPPPPRRSGGPALRAAAKPAPAPEVPAPQPVPPEPSDTVDPPGSAPSGIALFPPPGSDPPKRGLVVPEDFEVPEGYVRHYQATDDGQELAPILMFHPDYEWVDENGDPVEVPADRVVPPEMAPPGLAIEMLEIPAPRDEPDPER